MHKTLVGVVAVTVALLGDACGDDDDGDRLSTAEFETQANAICAEGGADVDAAADELFGDLGANELPDPAEVDEYVDDLLGPSVRDQLDEIRALEPPEDTEDEVDTFVETTESTLDELAEMSARRSWSS